MFYLQTGVPKSVHTFHFTHFTSPLAPQKKSRYLDVANNDEQQGTNKIVYVRMKLVKTYKNDLPEKSRLAAEVCCKTYL